MRSPATWSDLLANQPVLVDFSYELRPLDENVVQYIDGSTQYIAVRIAAHEVAGYGEAPADMPHTLTQVMAGQDFSVYKIPPYLVSVPAVTREFRDEGLESLKPVYKAIGRLLHEAANSTTVRPPLVVVSDIAVDPRSGELFYIPPLQFSTSYATQNLAYTPSMNSSIRASFNAVLIRDTIEALQREVTKGTLV